MKAPSLRSPSPGTARSLLHVVWVMSDTGQFPRAHAAALQLRGSRRACHSVPRTTLPGIAGTAAGGPVSWKLPALVRALSVCRYLYFVL